MFYIVRLSEGQEYTIDGYGPYETGSEAGRIATTLTGMYGTKCQPRRMELTDDSWRERAVDSQDEYGSFPKDWDLEPIADHYAVLDYDDDILFYQSIMHGILNRRTCMTVGRYLRNYYSHLDPLEIQRYANMVTCPGELLIADTADEIERVYLDGPESCMSHPVDHFDAPEHPVRVYAESPDLKLAYCEDRGGRIIGRALIWPDKMQNGRTYGDEGRMQALLDAKGYTRTKLHGARLPLREDGLMPYVDGSHVATLDEDGWLVITDPHKPNITMSQWTNIQQTHGYLGETEQCDHTQEWHSPDNLYHVHTRDGEQRWCHESRYRFAEVVYIPNRAYEQVWAKSALIDGVPFHLVEDQQERAA